MDIADNGEFRQRLVTLAELFDLKLAATRQALYFEALRDLPFEKVAQALNQAARVCKFFPKPAELRAIIVGDAEDAAEGAWMIFRKAMSAVGGYSSLVTANPALGETILAVFGSWPQACSLELSPEMWASKRKEFGRVYRVVAGRSLDGVRYLPGICETRNMGREEWKKYIPIAVLETDMVRLLEGSEAESYRQLAAAQRSELTQMSASGLERLLPVQRGETA